MKLYELFKGAEYVGEFTLDEIISITGAHTLVRSMKLIGILHRIHHQQQVKLRRHPVVAVAAENLFRVQSAT